jgi:Xaa-Pro aminopeptidase
VVEPTLARPFYLVVPERGAPVLLVHEARQREARAFSWVEEVRSYRRLSLAPVPELARILEELGLRGRRVGAELGFEQRLGVPFAEFERLRADLAPTRFVDAAPLLWRLRFVKSPADIDAHRRACRITAEAYRRIFAAVRPGDSELDIKRKMTARMIELGGDSPWAAITSGPGNYDLALGTGTERRIEPGDMVWLDAGCGVSGFWSDYSRAAVVGPPSTEQLDAHHLACEITREGVEMVAPGMPVAEIAAHCNTRVAGLGLPLTSNVSGLAGRIGHGIGLDVTEPPHVSEQDPTVLEPGMIISIEPGFATAFGIFHVEQNVLVTEDGRESLSVAPWELRALT